MRTPGTVPGMYEDLRESVTDHVRTEVGRGSLTFSEVVDGAVEYLEDEADPDEIRAPAWSVAGEEFAAALAEQATWPERTDNDRLTEAFRTLDAAGIVARQDYSCCQNCGLAEIVVAALTAAGLDVDWDGSDRGRRADADGAGHRGPRRGARTT